jgi:hypothetical protein
MHEVTVIKNPIMETRSGWHYSLSQTLIIEAIHLGNLLNPQQTLHQYIGFCFCPGLENAMLFSYLDHGSFLTSPMALTVDPEDYISAPRKVFMTDT